jgi:hypothetical protein
MRLSTLFVLAILGCGGKDGDDAIFDRIEVEPAQATLTVAIGGTASQTYQVFGVRGSTRSEITDQCVMSVEPTFGSASADTVTVNGRGGKTTVNAVCPTGQGTAQLIILIKGDVVVDPAPPNAGEVFDTATPGTDPARMPAILYPLDKAVSPLNIPSIDMQWTAAGNDLFHVSLRSSYVEVDVYTTAIDAMLPAASWETIANTAAGESLAITVEGILAADPTTKYGGPGVAMTMSRDNIDRSAIYWWASSAGSIMTQVFGEVTQPNLVKDGCTSCHSLSRTGTRLGYSRCVGGDCNQLFAGFLKFDPNTKVWGEAVNADNKAIKGSYTTFSPVGNPFPTDDQSLSIVSMSDGTLGLYDPDTGTPVASNIAVANTPPSTSALMADWSADGTKIVYSSTPNPGQWIDLSDSRIAMMSYANVGGAHTFGTPTMLVANPITLPTGTYNNFFFPSFSNDGALVVFNAARSAWRNGADARAPGQRLMLADTAGSFVVDLAAMNGGNDLDITWAHWAPADSNDYYWIVFSSERDYGHKLTLGNTNPGCVANGVRQCKQIWIGAVAKNKLTGATTMDPSAAPMWLPGQDIRANNISPFWTLPTTVQLAR